MQPSLDVSGRKLLAVLSPKYVHVSLRSKWDALKNSQLTSGETYTYLGERTLGEAAPLCFLEKPCKPDRFAYISGGEYV
jgi:hypothetical protein